MLNENRVTITLLEMARRAGGSSWGRPRALARNGRMESALVALLQNTTAYGDPLNKAGGSVQPRMSPGMA